MATSRDTTRDDLLRPVEERAQHTGGDQLRTLVQQYYRHVHTDDLTGFGIDHHLAVVVEHLRLGQARMPGQTLVRVTSGQVGGLPPTIHVITDDKPFLVDSITAALQRAGLPLLRIIHPIFGARRDEGGAVISLDDAADEPAEIPEAWIYAELDATIDEARADELKHILLGVLDDVAAAVRDWSLMRQKAGHIAADLETGASPRTPAAQVSQAQRFLVWLIANHFTFLGYREYTLQSVDGQPALVSVPGTGMGILADAPESVSPLRPEAVPTEDERRVLTITKANSRSTVHRDSYLDYVGIRTYDEAGNAVGEKRFVGLFTNDAYTESVLSVPVAGDTARAMLEFSGFPEGSHSEKDLLSVLQTYPRDELFAAPPAQLWDSVRGVMHLQTRPTPRLFLRHDEYGRFVSALVFIPRDRYNTVVRLRMEKILAEAYGGTVENATRVAESTLARLHFIVRIPSGRQIPAVDETKLEQQLVDATRTWVQDLVETSKGGDPAIAPAVDRYTEAFPEAYKEDFTAQIALEDIAEMEKLGESNDVRVNLYRDQESAPEERRLKLYGKGRLTLTRVLPVFTDLGLEVVDERPYELDFGDGGTTNIYDFGLRARSAEIWEKADEVLFEEAFYAVWTGAAESDGLNALVLCANMPWRDVVILRALAGYYRQIGSTFSSRYVEASVSANPELATLIVALFKARFDPQVSGDRQAAEDQVSEQITHALDQVSILDHDRILRTFAGIVRAVLRTNAFQTGEDGQPKGYLSLKLECAKVPGLPQPKPMFEIFVYAPCVEGVHLRFGTVARGGLRWSDRREDFRTEVLGLVKAQMVKNAVIVPTGSKGGFFAKCLPDPTVDRDAWMAAGTEAYKMFIRGMLDLTDNRVGADIVPPRDVVRHDGDDPYLVVAADKGTAKFSDIANSVSREYGFWLDDAFASGGSAGYDHKEMGITARGAWESVKRHFREMGHDTQTQDFTVVGVGDMSGDVFGNGMLLSEHIKLVCAFDHRDILLDPNPNPAASFAERQRLFELPRSSWQDYDTSLISEGGGIYSRSLKSIEITPQVREALGIDEGVSSMTPAELIKAALLAPVDLIWNGGIGTYIKASSESNSEIGDRANDPVRVDGNQLRAKVVGEGGNLGASQLGRIEASRNGVRIQTDAVDNSAGVDSSDHEVNIKILLTGLTKQGVMTWEQRDELLHSMTEELAGQVLRDNYEQNVLIGNHRGQGGGMLPVHQRLIHWLEERGELDRAIEFLPNDSQISALRTSGEGLSSPEFAVLMAYSKLALKHDLNATDLYEDPFFESTLANYFPSAMRERFGDQMGTHPLRKEIIVNEVANSMVNRGGVSMAFRAAEETGASVAQIARAFVVAREVFGLRNFVEQVEASDNVVDTQTQTELYLEFRRAMDRALRWLLTSRTGTINIAEEIERFGAKFAQLIPQTGSLLTGKEKAAFEARKQSMLDAGVGDTLADRYAGLVDSFSYFDIVELADERQADLTTVAKVYFATMETIGIDTLLDAVVALPRQDRWDALARGAMRYDLYGVLRELTGQILDSTESDKDAQGRIDEWREENPELVDRSKRALAGIAGMERPTLAPLSVALRNLRSTLR